MPPAAGSNPLATRFTRPGAIEFLFAAGESSTSLVQKLREQNWWGQIVGPHGSGKSTLLAALEPAIAEAGRTMERRSLAGGQRQLEPRPQLNAKSVLIVDGYEQLSWWQRRKVKAACRRAGAGLVVTAHSDVGLPPLFQTQPTLELAQQLVRRLLPQGDATLSDADVTAAFARHPDNLRETLFTLYDLYQARGAAR
jgi:energy-coupling factor transporter ATP-binding protein EcfA2